MNRTSDGFAIRVVIVMASVVTILGMLIMAYLAIHDIPIPDQIDRLTTISAAGALALLGRTSSGPHETTIANTKSDPVPVEETPKKGRK